MRSQTLCLQLLLLLLTLLAIQHHQLASAATAWGYGADNGPVHWPRLVPKWCSGRRQSPIHLLESVAELDSTLVPYTFSEPPAGTKFLFQNNGTGFTVYFRDSVNVSMGNGKVNSCWRPLSMHWHWGSVSTRGSEHWMEGKHYAMEGHVVMWDCRHYSSFREAAFAFDGLAMLGVFYEESATPDSSVGNTAIYNSMMANPELIRCPHANCTGVEVNAFSLKALLPSDLKSFFLYDGSLTVPDCRENVMYTIYKTPMKISSGFLQAFRSLRSSDDKSLSDKIRTLQPLNPAEPVGGSRKLIRSFGAAPSVIPRSAAHDTPTAAFVAVLLVLPQIVMVMVQ